MYQQNDLRKKLPPTVMASNTARLARVFTPEYARRINTQIVFPASSVVVKPNELESSLSRPLNVSIYEPHQPPSYLAATLCCGMIKGHPFQDGNKRTAFFIADQYIRALGLPGLADEGEVHDIAHRVMDVAAGRLV